MANTAQARKRVRQAVKARTRNAAQKSNFRSSIKKVLKSLADKNKEKSNTNFKLWIRNNSINLNKHIQKLA